MEPIEIKEISNDRIGAAKMHFLDRVTEAGPKFGYLLIHLKALEKWADKESSKRPELNKEVFFLSIWLHDIGQVIGDKTDHAVNSETEVRRYLPEIGVGSETVEEVAHCVRSHRCKDVQPETLKLKS